MSSALVRWGSGPSIPKRPEVHDAWIEAGCHGEMAWMESHRDVAADPNLVLPGAIRAICVLDRYPGLLPNTFLHGSGESPAMPEGRTITSTP